MKIKYTQSTQIITAITLDNSIDMTRTEMLYNNNSNNNNHGTWMKY